MDVNLGYSNSRRENAEDLVWCTGRRWWPYREMLRVPSVPSAYCGLLGWCEL